MSIPKNTLCADPAYNPNALIDTIIEVMSLRNDAALARKLEIPPPVISKLRNKRIPIGAAFLITAHEASGIAIREMKALANIPALRKFAG